MRKDLKIGLAIGGVLLVVLIVYMAVPKSDHSAKPGAELAQGDATDAPQQQPDAGSNAVAVSQDAGTTEVAGSATAAKPAGATGDPFATNAPSGGAAEAAAPEKPAAAGAGTNWGKLLETGEMPYRSITPSLSASNTVGGTEDAKVPEAVAAASSSEAAPASATEKAAVAATDEHPTTAPAKPQATVGLIDAQPTSTTSVSSAGARTHKVAANETFSSIAQQVYGDSKHYLAIMDANPDVNPKKLKPGTVIKLPEIKAEKSAPARSSDGDRAVTAGGRQKREIDPAKEYEVKPNDNLHNIAKRIYHNSAMMNDIYDLNKATIGDDPANLKVGMVLKLPAKPTTEPASAAR
jgi:nucleoid-associated protein YgaU